MASMDILGITCNVVYIDSTAVGANNGTTMSDALTSFPTLSEFTTDTVYLIRRNNSNDLTYSETSSKALDNIFFIGMPLTTDSIYESLPAEAKGTSWDSDSDTHANIFFTTGDRRIHFTSVENIWAHRIKFTRNDDTSFTSNNNAYTATLTAQGKTSYEGDALITNCESVTNGRDFSDGGYVDDLGTRRPGVSFSFTYFNDIFITNNKFIRTGRENGSHTNNYGFYVDYSKRVYVNNNIFWQENFTNSNAVNSSSFILFINNNVDKCEYNNNKTYFYGNQGSNHCYGVTQIYSRSFIVKNNLFKFDKFVQAPTNTNTSYAGIGRILWCDSYTATSYYAQTVKVIDGLKIDMRGSLSQLRFDCLYVDYGPVTNESSVSVLFANNGESILKNIEIYIDDESLCSTLAHTSGRGMYVYAPCQEMENVIIEAQSSEAKAFHATSIGKCHNFDIKGRVHVTAGSLIDIDNLEYTETPTTNVLSIYNALCRVKNIELNTSFEDEKWLTLNTSNDRSSSRIIIEKCNKNLYISHLTPNNISSSYGVWANNLDGLDGYWKADNYYYQGVTWGINRQEGFSASIKLTGTNNDTRIPLKISPSTFKGLSIVPNQTSGMVKLYFAHKLMSNPTLLNKRVRVSLEIIKDSSTFPGEIEKTMKESITDGIWEDDLVSTWDEPGLDKKVLSIPFETNRPNDPITMRLSFDWYDPSGYVYFDPTLEVV
jgi:hypothetical protein